MNPPGGEDADDDDSPVYAGSQPLDLALADRFALQRAACPTGAPSVRPSRRR
jgi:hypothetical protein